MQGSRHNCRQSLPKFIRYSMTTKATEKQATENKNLKKNILKNCLICCSVVLFLTHQNEQGKIMATVTFYTDKQNGKIYRVRSNSVIVQQYAAGSVIYSDGSSKGLQGETSFKTKKTLVSWLKMMEF